MKEKQYKNHEIIKTNTLNVIYKNKCCYKDLHMIINSLVLLVQNNSIKI